jgi:peptidoglycan hydrolase CwlO-like protein
MNKKIPALLAAFLVTGFIATAMILTSVNAFLNQNGTTVSNTPSTVSAASNPNQTQVDQLQARVDEYAQREVQYQQLIQTNQTQIQQYQQFILSLQQAGLIRINNDGTVNIVSRSNGD